MLPAEERPTVPVVPVKDAWRRKQGAEAVYLPSWAPQEENTPIPGRAYIRVMTGSPTYKQFDKHPHRLAAVLAHEAEHATQTKPVEAPAYARQLRILQQFGEKDKHLLQRMQEAVDRWKLLEDSQAVAKK